MRFIADFHIHSKYSHATSKFMDLPALAMWGQLKGVLLMGAGDFTHPVWQQELRQQLQEAEQGLFELAPVYNQFVTNQVYDSCKNKQRFMLTAEVSTVFKRNGRCYRTHSIILAPTFEAVYKISGELANIGNIVADGRPILGCDVRDIVKIVLNASPDCMIIPAHIWTPWYGLLGSKSGFNSVYECFLDLTEHIYALETGLSSNLLMNARVSELDRFTLLCNSDAHSVQNLGREANLMDTELSYAGITNALKNKKSKGVVAGIEFFPECGKYYGSGHRACNFYATPEDVVLHASICPKCKKALTLGVAHRINQLADRTEQEAKKIMQVGYKIVPLLDILSQLLGVADSSKKVQKVYQNLLKSVGPEFYILLQASHDEITTAATKEIADTIVLIRSGNVEINPGYDGVYGKVQF